jgi:trk system potassium uptake protein
MTRPAGCRCPVHLWRASGGVAWRVFHPAVGGAPVLAPMNLGGVEVISDRQAGAWRAGRVADHPHRRTRATTGALCASCCFRSYGGLTLALWIMPSDGGRKRFADGADPRDVHPVDQRHLCPASGRDCRNTQSGILGWRGSDLRVPVSGRALTPRPSRRHRRWCDRSTPFRRRSRDCVMAGAILADRGAGRCCSCVHWIGAYRNRRGRKTDGAAALRALWGTLFTTHVLPDDHGLRVRPNWADCAKHGRGCGRRGLILLGLGAWSVAASLTTAGGVKLLRVYALFRPRRARAGASRSTPTPSADQGHAGPPNAARRGLCRLDLLHAVRVVHRQSSRPRWRLVDIPFEAALVLTIGALTTTGQLAIVAAEEPMAWSTLGLGAKAILGAAMIVGRLETLAILALLSPDVWRR